MTISEGARHLLAEVAPEILDAQRPIRVLRVLAWDPEVERSFFDSKAQALPRPSYKIPADSLAKSLERFRALRARLVGDNALERYLRETCEAFETAARMLLAVGTREFYFHSAEIYGRPGSLAPDRRTTNLDLAEHFAKVVDGLAGNAAFLGPDDARVLDAEEAAVLLAPRFQTLFPDRAIRVEVVDDIVANAVAGVDVVRLKRGARFSRRDVAQLEHHEGQVHVATALNGRAQSVVPFIGYPSPRTTATQEGLAVFTEFLSQTTEISRVRRLAERTLAIKMAEDGASFLDLYRFFLERSQEMAGEKGAEKAAFDAARRVVRGGLPEGGAPFTKDVCYLDGLLRVTNFLRVALVKGHVEFARFLFVGKLDTADVPLFARLAREGLVEEPRYLPAWAQDVSYMTAFMSFAAFLGEMDLPAERRQYEVVVAQAEDELL